ncbi:MAG: hypothetical protein KKC03_13525 [Bacteroidetes bacterium]|nr:hypothetical protein [Bacteroidota bacterium]
MFDLSSIPSGGGVVAGGLIYVALAIGGGDLIGGRMIEKSAWLPRCEATIRQSAKVSSPADVPELSCGMLAGMFGPDGDKLCTAFGAFIEPMAGPLLEEKRRLADLDLLRADALRSGATSRCACAANVVLDKRTDWAIYAGSLRLMTPASVRNLDAELFAALRSPLCSGEGTK